MQLNYSTVDVFIQQRENLDEGLMQKIAAEFNYSETTFLQPAENPAHCAKVRILARGLKWDGPVNYLQARRKKVER